MSNRATARTINPAARAAVPAARAAAPAPRSTPRTAPRTTPVRPELRLVPGLAPVRSRRQAFWAMGSRRAPFVLLVVALLVGTTLGLLILNTAIAVESLKATELRAENAERAQEVQRLEQQVVTADTPAEIARAAAAAGMVPAGPAAYLVLDPDGGATLRGTPEPAEDPTGDSDGESNGSEDGD
jgi:cell division protein FtsB